MIPSAEAGEGRMIATTAIATMMTGIALIHAVAKPSSSTSNPASAAATVVPGPSAPHGTAMRPRRPRIADCRRVQPRWRRMGTPTVTPMPKPVTDSAKGTIPNTTSATPRGRPGDSDSTQAEICDIDPADSSSRASSMPKSRMSATSRMSGK